MHHLLICHTMTPILIPEMSVPQMKDPCTGNRYNYIDWVFRTVFLIYSIINIS